MNEMRIIFCGSGFLAVPVLAAISASGHDLLRVVTQPARPAGRGGKYRPSPLAQAAGEASLEVFPCADINDPAVVAELQSLDADIMCVVDFGQFIRAAARRTARLSVFNLHASLLPCLRGAAPINWAIIRGHEKTGVTTFELVDEMDAGPIYLQDELDVHPDETAGELRARLGERGSKLVCETIELVASGKAEPVEQDHAAASFAPKLRKSDGRIDWSAPAIAIRNLVHGTWPWPGARSIFVRQAGGEVPVTIAGASVIDGDAAGRPGSLDEKLAVSTGEGRLEIRRLKPDGKRLMDWRDFVNGYRVSIGDRFVNQS